MMRIGRGVTMIMGTRMRMRVRGDKQVITGGRHLPCFTLSHLPASPTSQGRLRLLPPGYQLCVPAVCGITTMVPAIFGGNGKHGDSNKCDSRESPLVRTVVT